MKKIATKSYIKAQQQTITYDPKRLKSIQQPQSDPKVKNLQQAFANLGIQGITTFSEPDAMILNKIQGTIRQKLRMIGFTKMDF